MSNQVNETCISDGVKVMVGVYRTDVPEPYLVWHNGGVRWKGIHIIKHGLAICNFFIKTFVMLKLRQKLYLNSDFCI